MAWQWHHTQSGSLFAIDLDGSDPKGFPVGSAMHRGILMCVASDATPSLPCVLYRLHPASGGALLQVAV
jgi:hypothetical protein